MERDLINGLSVYVQNPKHNQSRFYPSVGKIGFGIYVVGAADELI